MHPDAELRHVKCDMQSGSLLDWDVGPMLGLCLTQILPDSWEVVEQMPCHLGCLAAPLQLDLGRYLSLTIRASTPAGTRVRRVSGPLVGPLMVLAAAMVLVLMTPVLSVLVSLLRPFAFGMALFGGRSSSKFSYVLQSFLCCSKGAHPALLTGA